MNRLEAAISPPYITFLAPMSIYASDKNGVHDSFGPEETGRKESGCRPLNEGRFEVLPVWFLPETNGLGIAISTCLNVHLGPLPISSIVRPDDAHATQTERNIESIRVAAVREWRFSGALLLATALVDAEVFWLSCSKRPNMIAFGAVTVSAISTVLGIIAAAHLLVSYTNSNVKRLKNTLHVGNPDHPLRIVFRLPLLCALVSLVALALFVLVISFSVMPKVVITVCAVAMVLAGLQYITKVALKFVHAVRARYVAQ